VKRGAADGDAAHADGLHDGNGSERSGPSDLDEDVLDRGGFLGRRKFARDGPAGASRDGAETLLKGKGIDLENDAVDLIGESVASAGNEMIVFDACRDIGGPADLLEVDPESPGVQGLKNIPMASEIDALADADPVCEEGQGAPSRDPRVELPQGAGGGIARIGERRFAGVQPPAVQGLKTGFLHVDFAADLDSGGKGSAASGLRAQRHGGNRLQVERDVLADFAVAARGAGDEVSVLVNQIDGGTVQFGFGDEGHRSGAVQELSDPLIESADVLLREGIGQAQHRAQMADGLKFLQRWRADASGGRIGRGKVGEGGLQLLKLQEETVIFRIRYFRVVHLVVAAVVIIDQGPEFLDSLGGGGPVHHFTSFRSGFLGGKGLWGGSDVCLVRSSCWLKRWFFTRTELMTKKIMTAFSHSFVGSNRSIRSLYFCHRPEREASSRCRIFSAILSSISSMRHSPQKRFHPNFDGGESQTQRPRPWRTGGFAAENRACLFAVRSYNRAAL